jgi:hypothetical protein
MKASKRLVSEAVYEQLMYDESAPASVRLSAAQAYDALENGRPGIARLVNVEDIDDLTDDQCQQLFYALMRRFDERMPGFMDQLIKQAVDQQLAQQQSSLPRPNRFTRGTPQPKLAHHPQPASSIARSVKPAHSSIARSRACARAGADHQ